MITVARTMMAPAAIIAKPKAEDLSSSFYGSLTINSSVYVKSLIDVESNLS